MTLTCFAASFVTLGYVVVLAAVPIYFRLSQFAPVHAWESALVVEGWRAAHGLAVYEPMSSGHATLMYGPAQPYLVGFLYRIFPATKTVPQILSLASALGIVLLGVLTLRRVTSAVVMTLAAMSAFAIENRIGYFAEGRPDMIAWLLGFAGLGATYLYFQLRSFAYYIFGILLIVAGVAFKQPVAMLALVPPLALMIDQRGLRALRDHILGLGPLIGVAVLISGIWLFAPNVFFYMFTVPRGWPIVWQAWPRTTWTILAGAPCLWYAIAYTFANNTSLDENARRRLSWWLSLLVVSLPLAVVTLIKLGGTNNSLFPVWVALVGLSWHLIATRGLTFSSLRHASLLNAAHILAFATCLSFTLMPDLQALHRWIKLHATNAAEENIKYREMKEQVRLLSGPIYAPDDPAIALLATSPRATRSLVVEYDALIIGSDKWPSHLPDYVRDELMRAEHIVDVVGRSPDLLHGPVLTELGFIRQWSNGRYEIWSRAAKSN